MKKQLNQKNIGGIAGGQKFEVHGIIFKFANDKEHNGQWVYGGKYRSDYFASKNLNNELRSLKVLYNLILKELKLNIPLMLIIKYLGFSLCAISKLPIHSKSLCYGSNDAGLNIYNIDNGDLKMIISKISNYCKLKDHQVIEQSTKKIKKL